MRRIIVTIFLVIISFLLQCTIFYRISFSGMVPNIMLILTVSTGLLYGQKPGLYTGFFCGLLLDLFFFRFIGFNALVYMYIGFGNGSLAGKFFPDDIKLPLGLIVISDLVYSFATYFFLYLLRGDFAIRDYMLHTIIPEMVYTVLISVLYYPLILFTEKWIQRYETRGAAENV